MKELKVGDKIIDLDMSRNERKEILATVTKVSQTKITAENKKYPKSYPHNFYLVGLGANWDLIKQ